MDNYSFFNRDISWLSFNERLLQEAARDTVPLMERFKFLSIYSSNLDEFYRVRMPALMAVEKILATDDAKNNYQQADSIINNQQQQFGHILNQLLIPRLKEFGYVFINDDNIPAGLMEPARQYFFTQVAGMLRPVELSAGVDFFPVNNCIYLAVIVESHQKEQIYLVNIPSDFLPRFYGTRLDNVNYILYLEDVIKLNLRYLFEGNITASYNIKITRDAALELLDDFEADIAEQIEKQIKKRDKGFATRFLYQPGIPLRQLQYIIEIFKLQKASVIEGGKHHNLKDLASLPVNDKQFNYPVWKPLDALTYDSPGLTLFELIERSDRVVHAPYQSYETIIRFFNEAAINIYVEEIYTTLYRVASNSRVAEALISAAKNGKKVTVLVELKARFDEANNIHWAKKMKEAGVNILHSTNKLKVHAKVALVKRRHNSLPYLGLLATGNLNETTARFYTDHILMTAHQPMLAELQMLFGFLSKPKQREVEDVISFKHLLVAQFNLLDAFIALVNREINNANNGLPAAITIKLNNLEEEVLIRKLYEASNAGIHIKLIVRSICRLVPGIPAQSEHITVKRIVDRYLEHGRVFIFHNNSQPEVYMGSADWMNRNIYRRIEVCFPVYDDAIKNEMINIISAQWQDNVSAVFIDDELRNVPVALNGHTVRSQQAIYELLQK